LRDGYAIADIVEFPLVEYPAIKQLVLLGIGAVLDDPVHVGPRQATQAFDLATTGGVEIDLRRLRSGVVTVLEQRAPGDGSDDD